MTTPEVAVRAGQVVRIQGLVQLPYAPVGSVDGVMVWDSLGGRALARRFTRANGWEKFVLYRPVPEDGVVRVHLSMTGFGKVFFDDLSIETSSPPNLAGLETGEAPR